MPESVALSDLSATLCGARGHSASPTLRSTVPHRRRGPCSSVVGERGLPVRTPTYMTRPTVFARISPRGRSRCGRKIGRGPGSETGFAVSGPDAMGATVGCTPRIGRPEYRAGTRPGTLLDLWSYSRTSPPPSRHPAGCKTGSTRWAMAPEVTGLCPRGSRVGPGGATYVANRFPPR